MLVRTGQYTGAPSGQSITGVGFTPTTVIVKRMGTSTNNSWVCRTSTMGSNESKLFALNALVTDCITTLDADGFTVGTGASANTNGATYYYIALAADGANDDYGVFSWTGDGNDNTSVGSLAFTPELVIVMPASSTRPMWRTNQIPAGDASQRFDQTTTTNFIQAIESAGIQVGTNLNTNGVVFHALALGTAGGQMALTEYAGDGNDNRNIAHGLGATPVLALVQTQNVTSQAAVVRLDLDGVTDTSHTVVTGQAEAADQIQAMDGTNVQVGTHARVNQAASTPTYTLVTLAQSLPAVAGGSGNLMLLGVS